jgi:nitroreductase / dihydropteridine reductase
MSQRTILESLEWRYACKRFDSTKKLTQEQLNTLLQSLNLTATSMGMQLLRFVVVESPEKRAQILPHAHQQQQVTDASHLLVLCRETRVTDEFIEEYVSRSCNTRNLDPASERVAGFKKMLQSAQFMGEKERVHWMTNQVYIALGTVLTVCATERIDACPMEGFISERVDEVLGLKELGLASVLLLPVGYRHAEDSYAHLPKVRRPLESIVTYL